MAEIIKLETSPMGHSVIGPSGAKRYLHCQLSIELTRKFGAPSYTSDAAREGTMCHDVAARCLIHDQNPEDYLGKQFDVEGKVLIFKVKNAAAVRKYVDMVRAERDRMGAELHVEVELDMRKIHPDLWGQADAVLVNDEEMYVIDYKNGVYPVAGDDPQFLIYAAGAMLKFGVRKKFRVARFQPNVSKGKPGAGCEWEAKDLANWVKETLLPALTKAYEEGNQPVEGDWCTFCANKNNCPAKCKAVSKLPSSAVPVRVENLVPAHEMPDDAIAYVMSAKKVMEEWLNSVQEEALQRLQSGKRIEGLALAKGKKNRSYPDGDGIASALLAIGVDPFENKLRTPAQMEKHLAEALWNDADKMAKAKEILAKFEVVNQNDTVKQVANKATDIFNDETK